ncbi:MAG: RloB family protein [Methanomassiliicoccaceae archaeon]|jgi:hypothetical protein|nr:RloB family protein [Methanomassiliicoccaceae archaeon]
MTRNVDTRFPKNVILIYVEGASEKTYLSKLKERGTNAEIIVRESKRKNAVQMVELCVKEMKDLNMDAEEGDAAYCVFDVDENERRQMEQAHSEAMKNKVTMIVSHPFLEVWFLMHFREAPNHSIPKESIIQELGRSIGNYRKGDDVWKKLFVHKEKAIKMARSIASKNSLETPLDFYDKNFSTNMHILFDDIEKRKKHDPDQ